MRMAGTCDTNSGGCIGLPPKSPSGLAISDFQRKRCQARSASRSNGCPLSQIELAFCIKPVWGEMEPGTAMPIVASFATPCVSLDVRSTKAAIVPVYSSRGVAVRYRANSFFFLAQEDAFNLGPAKIDTYPQSGGAGTRVALAKLRHQR